MKILIAGARGQLGREWAHFLEDSVHDVKKYGSSEMDVTDSDQIHKIFREQEPDILINCAAYTDVDEAEDHSDEAYNINEIGVQNLAHECRRNDVLLVHFSTDYVFEGSEENQKKLPNGYDEEYPPDPQNVYGKSKRGGEIAVEKFAERWLIIRVSWLCGRYGNNFVKTIMRLSKEKEQLRVVNDQTGSPAFCFDVVKKTMRLVELNKTGYFHISSKGATTWHEITEEIIRITDSKAKLEAVSSDEFSMKAQRPAYSLLNVNKIKDLGLEPIEWKTGLNKLMSQLNELNHDH